MVLVDICFGCKNPKVIVKFAQIKLDIASICVQMRNELRCDNKRRSKEYKCKESKKKRSANIAVLNTYQRVHSNVII